MGSGPKQSDDYYNIDIRRDKGVDLQIDLGKDFPLRSNYIDKINAKFLLEHLTNPFFFLKESYRVLKPGGILTIKVPHADSPTYKEQPTHCSPFTYQTLPLLLGAKKDASQYYDYKFELEEFSFYYNRSTFWPVTGVLIKWFNYAPGTLKYISQLLSLDIRMYFKLKKA